MKYTIQRMRDSLGRRTKKTALEITENPVISKAVLCYFMLSLQALASVNVTIVSSNSYSVFFAIIISVSV